MARVTGIGGVFIRASDRVRLAEWYREHLGIPVNEHGYCDFEWRQADAPERTGRTVWSLFPPDTEYLGPPGASFMVNYRVDDLDELLAALRAENVTVDDELEEYEYGRFAWVTDPDGNRIELWEPPNAPGGEDADG